MGSLLLALIYICFVSLGLPDSLLGSAWPILHKEINVSISFAGIISSVICIGTIISSLFSNKLLTKLGTGRVTAFSCVLTVLGLFGFSISNRFWMLIVWAIPYGLGAGGIDAILNNYVALHYKPQHMSWLHCMWGVGASFSPYIMSFSLVKLNDWSWGYLFVSIIQAVITVIIFISIPIWKDGVGENKQENIAVNDLSFRQIFTIKGAIACFITFFCYCALELTASLWASTYLVGKWGLDPKVAAGFASLFYIGITLGRFINGFFAMKFSDHFLIRLGCVIIGVGIVFMFIPLNSIFALIGFIVVGLGCAPIYPCIIHMTPSVFGKENSQAMIGVQMAFAYTGFLVIPTIIGAIIQETSVALLPIFLLILLLIMLTMHEVVITRTKNNINK